MKNNLKYLYTFLTGILLISSCRDEDTIRIPAIKDGVSVKVVVDPAFTYFDFNDLTNSKFVFDVTTSNKDLQKVEFLVSYFDISNKKTYSDQVALTVTTFPARVEISPKELADLFALPGGIVFFGAADQFNFTTRAYLNDGRTFDASNTSPTMVSTAATSSFTSKFATFIGCASSIAGKYSSITTGTSTDADTNPKTIIDFASEITLTKTGRTTYSVSNSFGGLYLQWYAPYGITGALTGGVLNDICGNVTIGPFKDPFGGTVEGTGTIQGGIMTIEWENEYGDAATSVYNKK